MISLSDEKRWTGVHRVRFHSHDDCPQNQPAYLCLLGKSLGQAGRVSADIGTKRATVMVQLEDGAVREEP